MIKRNLLIYIIIINILCNFILLNVYADIEENYIEYEEEMFSEDDEDLEDFTLEDFCSIHQEFYEMEMDYAIEINNNKNNIDKDLTLFDFNSVTEEEFNEHILLNSPSDSPFINKGRMFISIGEALNINPYYIYAHASVESSHGKSNLAISKGNYFGIGAFNSDPSLAYTFISDEYDEELKMYIGLYNGAKWIKENYFSNGQNTLNKMLQGKIYAQLDDGTPNYHWRDTISYLMK